MPPRPGAPISTATSPFLGRARELAAIEQALADAAGGRGRIVIVAGEAGIGKSRLLQQTALMAADRGSQVLTGAALEDTGAPPYWLWRHVLRALVTPGTEQSTSDNRDWRLISLISSAATDSTSLAARAPGATDAGQQRFAVFEAVTRRMRTLTSGRVLVTLLDDVQWADAPSLRLLGHAARELADARSLIVAARRTPGPSHELLRATLAALARLEGTQQLELGGLNGADVARHLTATCGRVFSPNVTMDIQERTKGNPFFLTQYGRLLDASDADGDNPLDVTHRIPHGVRDVIAGSIAGLSPACRRLLRVAAVFGSLPETPALTALLGESKDRTRELIEEAAEAGILLVDPDTRGWYRFSHDLTRDTIYAEIPPLERARLHFDVAEYLERTLGIDPRRWVSELAHHRLRAMAAAGEEKAAAAAERAAEAALRLFAFEEAARLFLAAAEAAAASGAAKDRIARLLIAAARGQFLSGELERAAATCRQAGTVADAGGKPELTAEAALVLEAVGDESVSMTIAELCDDALTRLPDTELTLRSRLLAQRASAAHYLGDEESVDGLSRGALEGAEQSGDYAALSGALRARQIACSGPDGLEERERIAARMHALAKVGQMPWDELWSQLWRVDNLMQRGRLGDAANAVAQLGMFVDRINQPLARWHLERCRFAVALTLGDFSAARQAMESGDRYSRAAGDLAVSRRHLQHTLIAWLTGEECDEAIAAVESIARSRFRGLAAPWISGRLRLCNLALARGLRGEAERHYALLPAVGMDHVMPAMATVAAADRSVAAAELGHRQDCAILYKEMLPYADQFASSGAGAVACHGSMELFLGVCAVGLERHDVAMRHLEAAVERNDANGMRPWAAEARWWLARALHSRRRAGDAGRALALIAESREAATALGMAPLVRQLDELEPGVRRGTQRGRLLTKREEEIARLIAQGLTSREVGETVHISARTADNHVQHILDKLNLRSRSQIGAWIKGGRG